MASDTTTAVGIGRWRRLWLVAGVVGAVVLAIALLCVSGAFAPTVVMGRNWPSEQWRSIEDIDHHSWDVLLRRYVDVGGGVDYARWKASASDVRALDEYLSQLSQAVPNRSASHAARLAFWINAYNALTVRGILREYPTASIQDHVSRFGGYNIWRDLKLSVGNASFSLGQIEHDVLRPLNEPRIHFAIVCASRGCPRLLNRAYIAGELESQLQENTREFFADSGRFVFDGKSDVRFSLILKWYAGDFGKTEAEVLQSVAPYLPDRMGPILLGNRSLHVSYLDYDWSLNDQALASEPALPPDLGPALIDAVETQGR